MEPIQKSFLKKSALILIGVLILGRLSVDLLHLKNIFGIDLRNRVIGARMLGNTENLYFYPTTTTQILEYRDPVSWAKSEQNLITVTPSYLSLLKPLSCLNYKVIQTIWFCLEYLFLFSIPLLVFSKIKNITDKLLISFFAICCICFSNAWLTHIKTGQTYILYAFFIALVYFLYEHLPAKVRNLAFILLGIFSMIRFPLLLIAVPFLLKKEIKYFSIICVSFVVSFLSHSAIYPDAWDSYFKSMNKWGTMQLAERPASKTVKVPTIDIEGALFHPGIYDLDYKSVKPHNLSIQRIARDYFGIKLSGLILFALFGVGTSIIALFLHKAIISMNITKLLITGLLIMIFYEYFIPAAHNSYNSVQWIAIFCFILKEFSWPTLKPYSPLLIIGVLLNLNILDYFSFTPSIGELLLLGTILLLLRKYPQEKNEFTLTNN